MLPLVKTEHVTVLPEVTCLTKRPVPMGTKFVEGVGMDANVEYPSFEYALLPQHLSCPPAAIALTEVAVDSKDMSSAKTCICTTMLLHENVPLVQTEQEALPLRLNCPLEHIAQAAELVAPAVAENVSAGHRRHVALLLAPVDAEYVPARHCVHVAALVEPTAVEKVPAPHAVHEALAAPLQEPAGHALHVDRLVALVMGEAVPAGHDVHDVFPARLYVPVPQGRHAALLVADKVLE
jgi:hypothetical protein